MIQTCLKMEPEEFVPETVTSLSGKFKRLLSQLKYVRDFVGKLSIGLDMLEAENQSLRSSIKYLCSEDQTLRKETPPKQLNCSPRAVPFTIEALYDLIDRLETRLNDLHDVTIREKKSIEEAREEIRQEEKRHERTKTLLHHFQQKMLLYQDKTTKIKETIELMEHVVIKETNKRIEAERRAHCLSNETAELREALNEFVVAKAAADDRVTSTSGISVPAASTPTTRGSIPNERQQRKLRRVSVLDKTFSIGSLRQTTTKLGEHAVRLANTCRTFFSKKNFSGNAFNCSAARVEQIS